ncbi:MAG: FG-GAP repeat protein [Rubricoccaceae bacterium]
MRDALLLPCALLIAACGADSARLGPSAQTGEAPGPEYVIAPGPEDPEDPWDALREHPEWERRAELAQARAQARAFWQRHEMGLEEDFAVVAMAEGRFADSPDGPAQTAVLYRMSGEPRCCARMGLAVVEGERLVRNVAFDGGAQTLRVVPDLDGDGFDELVIGASGGGQGYVASGVELVSLGAGGQVRSWGRLQTGESDCGAMGSTNRQVRVTARSGPVFTAQPFEGSCQDETLRAAGPPAPVELDPPLDRTQPGFEWSVGYVVLPAE